MLNSDKNNKIPTETFVWKMPNIDFYHFEIGSIEPWIQISTQTQYEI